MPRALRIGVSLLLATAVAVTAVPVVSADIDPASDVLLLQDVFLPYRPRVCVPLSNALRDVTKATKKAGYPVKVAVISSPNDLGGAVDLFGRPQPYAKFLGGELGIFGSDVGRNYRTNLGLLVVMPAGYGYFRTKPDKASQVASGLKKPSSDNVNDLARAALDAVPKLAAAAGHPVQAPAVKGGCSGSGGGSGVPLFVIFGLPVVLLVAAGAVLALRNRPEPGDGQAD